MTPEERATLCVGYVMSVVHRDEYKLADWQAEKWELEIERHIRDAQREAAEAMREACAKEVMRWADDMYAGLARDDQANADAFKLAMRIVADEFIRKLTWPL